MLHFFTALQTTITASGKLEHPAKQPKKPHHPELPPYNNFPILSPTLTLVPKFACCILPSQVTPTAQALQLQREKMDNSTHAFQTNLKIPWIPSITKNIQKLKDHSGTSYKVPNNILSLLVFYLLDFAVLSGWNRLQLGDRILPINSGLPRNKRKDIRNNTWTIQSSNKSLA